MRSGMLNESIIDSDTSNEKDKMTVIVLTLLFSKFCFREYQKMKLPISSYSRSLLTLVILVALALAAASCGKSSDGERAADFELTLYGNADFQAGDTIKLSQFDGEPVVLNFWFPSCPPCVAEMPDFEVAYQKYKSDGLRMIGIQLLGLDTAEDGQKFVQDLSVNYMLGPDRQGDTSGEILRNYQIQGFPTTIFMDKDHNIVRSWSGALNLEKLEELIEEIL